MRKFANPTIFAAADVMAAEDALQAANADIGAARGHGRTTGGAAVAPGCRRKSCKLPDAMFCNGSTSYLDVLDAQRSFCSFY
jgi:outer membrane protein TolC